LVSRNGKCGFCNESRVRYNETARENNELERDDNAEWVPDNESGASCNGGEGSCNETGGCCNGRRGVSMSKVAVPAARHARIGGTGCSSHAGGARLDPRFGFGWGGGMSPAPVWQRPGVLIPKYPHEMEMWNLRTLVASLRIFSNATAFFSNFRVARRS
jgi:hypothetical protein